jgi:hypothetical protein
MHDPEDLTALLARLDLLYDLGNRLIIYALLFAAACLVYSCAS